MVSRDLGQPLHNPVHLEHRTTPGCRGPTGTTALALLCRKPHFSSGYLSFWCTWRKTNKEASGSALLLMLIGTLNNEPLDAFLIL